MQKTSSVATRRNPSARRKSRARKNPFGLLDGDFLKDALMPAAIGFASGHIRRAENRKTFEFWDKLDIKFKILGLVFAATWLRRKGKHQAEGACLAIAGQYIEQFWKARQAKGAGAGAGAGVDNQPDPREEPAGALIDYEMEEAMGAIFDGDDDSDALDAVDGLSRVYDDDYAMAG